MAARVLNAATVDGLAISLSSLCLIHCLFLPILSAALPFVGIWAEAEWLHKAFVVAALPFSLLALSSTRANGIVGGLIATGFLLLFSGAFFEPLETFETVLTVIGGAVLAAGHALAWRRAHAGRQA